MLAFALVQNRSVHPTKRQHTAFEYIPESLFAGVEGYFHVCVMSAVEENVSQIVSTP